MRQQSQKDPQAPHPFRDLTDEQKVAKVREMAGSGCFGIGVPMLERLARIFGVPVSQIAMWMGRSSGQARGV